MTTRRRLLSQTAAISAATLLLPRAACAQSTPHWPARAFDAMNLTEVLGALGITGPAVPSTEIQLQAPDLTEDGAQVPLQVVTQLGGVRQMALVVDRNPGVLSALFMLGDAVEPNVALRLKMAATSDVHALALLADGRVLVNTREVRVTAGGCAGSPEADVIKNPVAIPTRMRAQAPATGGTLVRALLGHEMESGQRIDERGQLIPAWHITEVNARLNGEPVLGAWWGPSVSRNPYLQFTLKRARVGDRLAIDWLDNRGGRRSDETSVS